MTLDEILLGINEPEKAIIAITLGRISARNKALEVFPPSLFPCTQTPEQHTKMDAFRHAYWMALTTKYLGEEYATALGNAHESGGSGPYSVMDLHNNSIGIKIARGNPEASDEQLATLIKNYRYQYVEKDTLVPNMAGTTDQKLVYVKDCGSVDYAYSVTAVLSEKGYGPYGIFNWGDVQPPQSVEMKAPAVGNWEKSITAKYHPQFSGNAYIKGSLGPSIDMEARTELILDHPGGGLINFSDLTAFTTIGVYVPIPRAWYRVEYSTESQIIATSEPNDGRPGTDIPGTSAGFSIRNNGQPLNSSGSFTIFSQDYPTMIDGKKMYQADNLVISAASGAGFSAIINVPPLKTVSIARIKVSANIVLIKDQIN